MAYICMLKHQIIRNVNTVLCQINCLFFEHHHCILVYSLNLFFSFIIWLDITISVKLYIVYYVSFTCSEIPCFWWHNFLIVYCMSGFYYWYISCLVISLWLLIMLYFAYITFYFTPNSSKKCFCIVSWIWSGYCFLCWQNFVLLWV